MTANEPSSTERAIGHPVFAQPEPTADPKKFRIKHASDKDAYASIDALNRAHKLKAMAFPAPRGLPEPKLTFEQVLGGARNDARIKAEIKRINDNEQIVFHSGGDCGATRTPKHEDDVTNKMIADFDETTDAEVPRFHLLLGDIVYSFGELQYYYDQFYDPYRNYPAPILAAAGNHDGMIAPNTKATTLTGYIRNFCAESFVVTPEAGGLSRTAQIQPGVFFTFEAPFVRIIVLYSNVLEDPGVIANRDIGLSQIAFLEAALDRVLSDKWKGALIFADHHPPYSGIANTPDGESARHGWSTDMLAQIDEVCESKGIWPHAFLSGHAHNYQRFTRTFLNARGEPSRQIPYIVCGNIGHNVTRLSKYGAAIRAPQLAYKDKTERVAFENYDDKNYGYLRVIASSEVLRVEYHPADDGSGTKTPDDAVTVNLASRLLTAYKSPDMGAPAERRSVEHRAAANPPFWEKR
jgi:hypothetical protein